MDKGKTVIIGVGNILWGDEGVGVHVLSELKKRYKFPPDVVLVDGGTGGIVWLPLVLEAKRLIIIDCADFGGSPGEIKKLSLTDITSGVSFSSTHGMKVPEVLTLANSIGSLPDTVIFGIQPANWQEAGEGLSAELSRFLPDYLKSVISELGSYGIEIKDRG